MSKFMCRTPARRATEEGSAGLGAVSKHLASTRLPGPGGCWSPGRWAVPPRGGTEGVWAAQTLL